MLPNKWVIFWDSYPVGISSLHFAPMKIMDGNPNKVAYFDDRYSAELVLRMHEDKMLMIKEIQFRIVG